MRRVRAWRTALGVAIVALLVAAALPTVRALNFPRFGDSIHDYAVDLDFDGYYDELRIDFTATVVENATYGFEGILGTYILHDEMDKTLTAGTYTFTFVFLGPFLNKYGIDGPYVFQVRGSEYVGSVRWGGSSKTYSTAAYLARSFEPPWAVFGGPVTDQVRDTDGDGRYDQLVIRTSIEATRDVVVEAYAHVAANGRDGWAQIDPPFDSRSLGRGSWPQEFVFDTLPLYTVHADGPYTVELRLNVEGLGFIDYRSYATQAYSSMAFRRPSADFRAPGPSVGLVDADGNGRGDLFVVRVPLQVTEAGDFLVYSNLWLSGSIYSSGKGAHLERGNATVEVPFSGILLGRHPYSANWTLEVNVQRVDSNQYDRNRTAWLMPGYDPSVFESRPVVYLTGYIPGACGDVSLMDPATKFATEVYAYYGSFYIELYPSSFLVLARSCGGPGAPRVSTVNVSGNVSVTLPLGNMTPDAYDVDMNLTNWNALRTTVQTEYESRAPEMRYFADFYGNRDGFADSTELRIFRASQSTYFMYGWLAGRLAVDGRGLPLQSLVLYRTTGAGDVVSPDHVTEEIVVDSQTQIEPVGFRHNVSLWTLYDSAYGRYRATVHLPPGSTGTVTAAANITVVPIGVGAWSIDPGASPNPQFSPSALVYIDAVAPGGPGGVLPVSVVIVGLAAASAIVVAVVSIVVVLMVRARRRRDGPRDPPPAPPGAV